MPRGSSDQGSSNPSKWTQMGRTNHGTYKYKSHHADESSKCSMWRVVRLILCFGVMRTWSPPLATLPPLPLGPPEWWWSQPAPLARPLPPTTSCPEKAVMRPMVTSFTLETLDSGIQVVSYHILPATKDISTTLHCTFHRKSLQHTTKQTCHQSHPLHCPWLFLHFGCLVVVRLLLFS